MTATAPSAAPDAPRVSARRAEVLGIAKELIARKGYASTSTRDIAEACGMLPGSLYSHFRSKAEILQLVLAPFYEQLVGEQEAAVAEGGTGAAQLEAMVRRVLVLCSANPAEITILHYDWPSLGSTGELAPLVVRGNATLDLWRTVIERGVVDGSLRADIDAEVATRVITSSIHGVLDRHRYDSRPDLAHRPGLRVLADELVTQLLRGLRARP
jgi:AcrR family transcriptional regulator